MMAYATGDKYEGGWVNNKPEGKGVMAAAQGDRHEGSWVGGKQEGKGSASLPMETDTKECGRF